MAQPTLLERLRYWIGGIAWQIYLWSNQMTAEEYFDLLDIEEADTEHSHGYYPGVFCEHGYNGVCPDCDALQTPPYS